jgi:hypothetical protein
MDNNNEFITQIKKAIRETLEWKDTDELITILTSTSDEWTQEAKEVAEEILKERGEDLDRLDSENVSSVKDKKETIKNLSLNSNWSSDSLHQVPPRTGEARFIHIPENQSYVKNDDGAGSLICSFCESTVPQDAKFCPYCGNALYSDVFLEEEYKNENAELFEQLNTLSLEELNSECGQIVFAELGHPEALAWRHAYSKFGLLPIWFFDQGEVLKQFYPFLSDESIYLLGFPGNRTLPNKWGLDLIENRAEFSHVCGVYLSQFLRFQFRTKNQAVIASLFLTALICLSPLIGFFVGEINLVIIFILFVFSGLILLGNAILCLFHFNDTEDDN